VTREEKGKEMTMIVITSKLTPANGARLRRAAAKCWMTFDGDQNAVYIGGAWRISTWGFCKLSGAKNTYSPIREMEERGMNISHAHAVARHMMVVCGQTFSYEVVA